MHPTIGTTDDLQWPDYLAAVLAHLLLITLFFMLAHSSVIPPPPVHPVQVQLITSQSLHKRAPPHHKKAAKKKAVHKKAVKKKAVIKHKVAAKPPKKIHKRPAKKIIKKRVKAQPHPKPKRHAKKVAKKLDFDPFAPQQSASDAPTLARRHHTTKPSSVPRTSNKLTSGMTSQEINRYIARIQRQVQNQWKVPAKSPRQLNDPEVLLRLNRNGSIAQISISSSSGDSIMDQSLIKAIRAAAPFNLPPNNFDLFRINRISFHPLH